MSQEGVIAWKAASSELHNDSGAHIIAIWLLQKDIHNKHVGVFLVSAYIPIDNTPDDVWNKYSDILTASLIWKCKSYILNIGTDANSSMETGSAHCDGPFGYFGLNHVNESGKCFLSYLNNNNPAVITFFKKNEYATWIHTKLST